MQKPRLNSLGLPRRVPLGITALLLVGSTGPVFAQDATPVDVYMACRNPLATFPVSRADTLLRNFCQRRLPDPGKWNADSARHWLDAPDGPAIRGYAQATLNAQRKGVEALLARQNSVRGSDESQGLLGFTGDAELDPAGVMVVQQLAERLATRIGSGAASGLVIVGYPDAPGDNAQALRRAQAVEQVLRAHPFFATQPITLEPGEAAKSPSAQTPGVPGKATLHLVLPLRSADAFASLGEIRFPPDGDRLDEASMAVVARAAAQIVQARLPADAPIVVYGYADSSGGDVKNERLAQNRANAIREALVAILQVHGFSPELIVARGRVLDEQVHNYSAERREQVRSGAILAGGNALAVGGADAVPAAAPSQVQAPSAASVMSVEGIATAAAQVLVERAEREVEGFVFQLVGSEVCKHDVRHLLPETCLLVHDPEAVGKAYQLSFGNLQAVIRRDFAALPTALVTDALANRFGAQLTAVEALRIDSLVSDDLSALRRRVRQLRGWPQDTTVANAAFRSFAGRDSAMAERIRQAGGWAVAGVFGLDFVRRVSEGENPLRALQHFPLWMDRNVQRRPELAYLAGSAPVLRVATFARFMSGVDSAAIAFREAGLRGITSDTLHLYALRTALVNVGPGPRRAFAAHVGHVVGAGREFQEMLVTADSLRRRLRELQDEGEASLDVRRQLVAGFLGDVAGTFYTLLPSSPSDMIERDSVARIAGRVRDVVFAVNAGELRAAFTGTITLISQLLRTPVLGVSCDVATLTGCGRVGLDPRVVRLAAFASDVGAARSDAEARDAMNRFLDAGTDVRLKRTGPPGVRAFINAYVAGAVEVPNLGEDWGRRRFSLQIPVGIEGVLRTDAGVPDWTGGLFLRLVELGGFLPSEDQTDGRSTDELIASLVRPGIFVLVGAPKGVPFTLGAGFTMTLTEVSAESQLPDTSRTEWDWKTRFAVFLGWDIPIFP